MIGWIIRYERFGSLANDPTKDYEKYVKIGLQLEPNNSDFLYWYGLLLQYKQYPVKIDHSEVDYSYIEYFEKAYETSANDNHKRQRSLLNIIQYTKQLRNYHAGSLWQIKHLIQFDSQPNLDLKEPRWEIYKITTSFLFEG